MKKVSKHINKNLVMNQSLNRQQMHSSAKSFLKKFMSTNDALLKTLV